MENMDEVQNPEWVDEEEDLEERAAQEEQDFYQLRRECLSMNVLFEDPQFPAEDSSVYFSKRPDEAIEWKRPTELTNDPNLYVDGFSRFDLNQGDLSDCWFISAVANLSMHPELFSQVVPEGQSFQENYAGIFHFRFWQYGKWVDVVIDDRLPTSQGKLMFLCSPDNEEFWGALLEKAYAKLHGSYEALVDGMNYEAMEDFTGGIVEMYNMNELPPNLFKTLLKAVERHSLLGCILQQGANAKESKTPEGLVRWHCYSITHVKYVYINTSNQSKKVLLMRLRNPWGNEHEWNGKWSDESAEWNCISDKERERLGLKFDFDGEFWMTFKDFKRHFSTLDICNLSPDSLMDPHPGKKKWEMRAVEGEWIRGVSAGGSPDFTDTFPQNPQYRIRLGHPDDGEDNCTVIVALSQMNQRARKWKGAVKLHIGFVIYHLENPNTLPTRLDNRFFDEYRAVAGSPMYLSNRGVTCRFQLIPGVYCIIPSTFDPHEEGQFYLRIFCDSEINIMRENEEQVAVVDDARDTSGDCSLLQSPLRMLPRSGP